jgi:capsular exopolysaccharide synthesis family protein
MNDFEIPSAGPPARHDGSDALPALMQFAQLIVRRRATVLAAIAAASVLGAAYYAIATRYFESAARLLIVQQKPDHLATVGDHDSSDNTMATQRELVRSPVVLRRAIERLDVRHRVDLADQLPQKWVETLARQLETATTRRTNFIDVSYRSRDPEAAVAVVRAVIESYLAFVKETHSGTAGEVIDVLTSERTRLQESLAQKQQELQAFRERVGHLGDSQNDSVVEPVIQRALHFNEALLETQQRRVEIEAALAAATGALQRGEDVFQHLAGLEDTVGRQLMLSSLGMSSHDLQLLGDQEERLIEATEELRSVSAYLGPNHKRVVALQQQIASLEQYLATYQARASLRFAAQRDQGVGAVVTQQLQRALEQIRTKEQQLLAAFDAARHEASQHSGELVELKMREREVQRLESWHDMLFEKIAAVDIRQVQAPIQATVVREPLADDRPVSPQARYVAFAATLGGGLIGCLIAYVQDLLDDRFSSPEELASQLAAPVLAIVRELPALAGAGIAKLHAHAQPSDPASEAFRTLRTAITLGAGDAQRLLVSSSEPGDGKTTVCANLAVAFARAGKKTLLVDADLRKPGLTTLLGLKAFQGVGEILAEGQSIQQRAAQFVQTTDEPNLDVLPTGIRRPNPSELLSGAGFVELLGWAESRYDQVLVDCPPVLAVSDAQVIGRLVDGAVIVVRPEKNHRRLVQRAVASFRATGCRVLGVVANGVTDERGRYGYGYGYGYGEDYRYGAEDDRHDPPEADPAKSGQRAA